MCPQTESYICSTVQRFKRSTNVNVNRHLQTPNRVSQINQLTLTVNQLHNSSVDEQIMLWLS